MRERTGRTSSFLHTILFLATMSTIAHSQSNITSARSAGLRRADVAEFGEVEAFHQNPASLAFVERTALALSHVQPSSDGPSSETVDVPVLFDHGFGIGASLGVFHQGYFPKTSHQMLSYIGEVGVGYEAMEYLAIGASISLSYATLEGSSAPGVFSSFGLLYAPTSEISYTLTFGGVGTEASFVRNADSLSLASTRRPRSLQIGIAMRFPSSASSREQFFGFSVANEKIIGQDGLIYKGGMEVLPTSFLALRVGYEAGPEISGYAGGIGVSLGPLRIDYALSEGERAFLHHATVACEL